MSLRAGTAGLVSGALTASLYSGLGATGAVIKAASATGTDGAGPLFNDGLIDASEYYWYVVNAPATGVLTLRENGQAEFVPAADGTVTWAYALVEDGVLLAPQPTVTITVGAGSPLAVTASAQSTVTAALTLGSPLAVTASAQSTVTAGLTTKIALSAVFASYSTVTASLTAGLIAETAHADFWRVPARLRYISVKARPRV